MLFKNFINSIGSLIELFPSDPPQITTFICSDEEAMKKDWEAIGNDLKTILNQSINEDDQNK